MLWQLLTKESLTANLAKLSNQEKVFWYQLIFHIKFTWWVQQTLQIITYRWDNYRFIIKYIFTIHPCVCMWLSFSIALYCSLTLFPPIFLFFFSLSFFIFVKLGRHEWSKDGPQTEIKIIRTKKNLWFLNFLLM